MKIKNVWKDIEAPLELHSDERGSIVDIFYNESIHHVNMIKSAPGVTRGNHFHKLSTQHMLMTKGSLEYWYKPVDSNEPAKMVVAREGDLISTPPNEIHALRIGPEGNEFITFATGARGGKDYESDTYRVDSIIDN